MTISKSGLVAALLSLTLLSPPAYGADRQLTVVSRNLYLGADVGVALDLIPDLSAAAQFMWDQVAATNFTKRAPVLAQEIIDADADVVGLQEATHWYCKKNAWSSRVIVFDFVQEFLAATKAAGHEYVLVEKDGVQAFNIGYSIPAIPFFTIVNDSKTFQPIFGSDSAACGFEIGDALVVKKDLASSILNVGNTEYEVSYGIIPKTMIIYRGYTWADLHIDGSNVRIVSTHLESLWDENAVPHSALQAQQLVADLTSTTMPLIVMGDFNADPRDPRPTTDSNPGGQPVANENCPAQVAKPTIDTAKTACNAYWTLRKAGFADAGPDALDPRNYSWGMSALLQGPDPVRLKAAQSMGNQFGFTDRLDYIFIKNGISVISSRMIGNTYPEGSTWQCGTKKCNDTDHAGVVVTVSFPESVVIDQTLPEHAPFPISFWNWVGIGLSAGIIGLIIRRKRKKIHE